MSSCGDYQNVWSQIKINGKGKYNLIFPLWTMWLLILEPHYLGPFPCPDGHVHLFQEVWEALGLSA